MDSRALGRGLFRPEAVRQLVEEHVTSRWDHAYRLWSLLCLELWQQTFLDPAAPPGFAPPRMHRISGDDARTGRSLIEAIAASRLQWNGTEAFLA